MSRNDKPIPNSYWLPGASVVAGEYPGHLGSDVEAREKIAALVAAGVTAFIDLTAPADGMVSYESILAEEAARLGVTATRVSLPVRDMDVPPVAELNRILDTIEDFNEEGRTVYVHCWGGVGRTGLVAGCFLVRNGLDGDAALRTVADLFGTMTPEKVSRHAGKSPQTIAQCETVRDWRASDAPKRRK